MRSVSNAFKQVIQNGGPFYAWARIFFTNNTYIELKSDRDFFISGNKYDHSFSSAFPLGEAACKTIDIGINNSSDRFSVKDFDGAVIHLSTEVDVGNSVERLEEGVFNVIEAKSTGDIIEISAADNMYKTDCKLEPIVYPATLGSIVSKICTQCGLQLADANFPNHNKLSLSPGKDTTCREMLGYIAQMAGGNALIDVTGKLYFKSYQQSSTSHIISGGVINDSLTDSISGGEFGDNITNSISSHDFNTDLVLSDYTADPQIAVDDVTITGVSYTYKSNNTTQTILYGQEGYVLKIENPILRGTPSDYLQIIGNYVIGITVRPFSGSFKPNPTIELMDNVYIVDRKNNIYQSFITSNTFNYLGASELANEVESLEKNKTSYSSSATQVYKQVQEDIQYERTSWESAVEQLNEDLANASGLFETQVEQPDHSIIYYFHDKSELSESQNIIKVTSQAIAISTDGGQTFPTGVTVDGNAIVSILQSVGINADWINTGTLSVGGTDNTEGTIAIYNQYNEPYGAINNDGVTLSNGAFLKVNNTATGDYTQYSPTAVQLHNSTSTVTISKTSDKFDIKDTNFGIFRAETSGNTIYGSTIVTGTLSAASMTNTPISNTNLTGTIKSNGNNTFTGSINFIESISSNGQGRISWVGKIMDIENGLITGVR